MTTNRNESANIEYFNEIFQHFYRAYQTLLNTPYDMEAAQAIWSAVNACYDIKDDELIKFCSMHSDDDPDITGLYLILWCQKSKEYPFHTAYRNLYSICYSIIRNITNLSDEKFQQIDFSPGIFEIALYHGELFFKLLSLSKEILQTFRLDGKVKAHKEFMPSGLIIKAINQYGEAIYNNIHLAEVFVYLIAISSPIDDKSLRANIVWGAYHDRGNILWKILIVINSLKNAINKLDIKTPETLNRLFSETCKDQINELGIMELHLLVKHIDLITTITLPFKIVVMEKFANDRSILPLDIRRTYHDELAQYYFTQPQPSLADKLSALQQAFKHALLALPCQPNSDFRMIWRIAEVFLYANEKNLNNPARGISTAIPPQLTWLKDELVRLSLEPSDTTVISDHNIHSLLTQLKAQRYLIGPLLEENAELTKRLAVQEEKTRQLEQKLAALANLLEQKNEAPDLKPSPRLF